MAPLDFIELADGTKVSTATGEAIREKKELASSRLPVASINASDSSEAIVTRLADLPLDPKKMNGVAAMIVYRLLGMPDYEIAQALGTTDDKVKAIANAQVFTDLFNKISTQILDKHSSSIRVALAAMSRDALNKVYDIMVESDDKNALKAAQDILDRAGHRPADVVLHQHQVNGGLKIEFIQRTNDKEIPTITIEQ